jgi:hypothetical protein
MMASDASSFISDTASFTETFANTRALSFGTSFTTAKPRVSPSAWTKKTDPIPINPNNIRRKDRREVIAYLLYLSHFSREPIVSGRSIRDRCWSAEECAPWLRILESVGLTTLGCGVVAGVIQSIMNPITRTQHPMRTITNRDMGFSPVTNGGNLSMPTDQSHFKILPLEHDRLSSRVAHSVVQVKEHSHAT